MHCISLLRHDLQKAWEGTSSLEGHVIELQDIVHPFQTDLKVTVSGRESAKYQGEVLEE